MKGFPQKINSKADLVNLKTKYPVEVSGVLNRLLAGRNRWMITDVVPDGEAGMTDATHKVVTNNLGMGQVVKTQHEYKEDPNAEIFRLGFTVSEAESLLSSIGV